MHYQQIEELLHSIPSTIYGLPPPIFCNESNEFFSSFSHDYIDLLRYIMLTIQFSLPCSISISSFFHLGYDFVVHCFQHILVLSPYLDSIFYLLYHYLYIITEYHHLQLSPVMSSIQSILLSPSFIQVFLMIYALSIGDEAIWRISWWSGLIVLLFNLRLLSYSYITLFKASPILFYFYV